MPQSYRKTEEIRSKRVLIEQASLHQLNSERVPHRRSRNSARQYRFGLFPQLVEPRTFTDRRRGRQRSEILLQKGEQGTTGVEICKVLELQQYLLTVEKNPEVCPLVHRHEFQKLLRVLLVHFKIADIDLAVDVEQRSAAAE